MEVDQVEAQIAELSRVMGHMDLYAADRMRALAYADDLQLFWIINTVGRKAYFLARSAKLARHAAVAVNHIQLLENGECFRATDAFYRNNPGFGSSVKRAIKNRMPGLIVEKGNHAVIGDVVHSPMTVV